MSWQSRLRERLRSPRQVKSLRCTAMLMRSERISQSDSQPARKAQIQVARLGIAEMSPFWKQDEARYPAEGLADSGAWRGVELTSATL